MRLGNAPEQLGKLAHATEGGTAVLLRHNRGWREVRPAGATTATIGEVDVHGCARHGRGGRRPWQGRQTDMAAARKVHRATEGGVIMLQWRDGRRHGRAATTRLREA